MNTSKIKIIGQMLLIVATSAVLITASVWLANKISPEDGLFEEMSKEDSKTWPLKFAEAIPVGADLSMVFIKLTIWEWEDETHGLKNIKEIQEDKELYQCCEDVVGLYKRHLAGEKVKEKEWIKLEELAGKIYSAGAGAGAWAEYEKQIMVTAEKLLEILRESK